MLPIPNPCPVLHHPRRRGLHRYVPRLLHLQLPPDNPTVSQRDVDSPHTPGIPNICTSDKSESQHFLCRLRWQVCWKEIARTKGVTQRTASLRRKKMRERKNKNPFLYSYNRFDKSYDYIKPLLKVMCKKVFWYYCTMVYYVTVASSVGCGLRSLPHCHFWCRLLTHFW